MTYEIVKINKTEYHIVNVDTEVIVSTYSRIDSAKRGLKRLLAKEVAEVTVSGDIAPATGAAEATQGAGAVETPPTSNTGGQKSGESVDLFHIELNGKKFSKRDKPISEISKHYVMIDGEVKEIPLRKGYLTCAHIDTITLTFSKYSLLTLEQSQQCKTEDEEDELILANAEPMLFDVFGFSFNTRGNGKNGYAKTANMGAKSDERIKYGFFGWGNGDKQGCTVCLHISGVGVTAALDGWEHRLYDWIKTFAPFAKITRIDLAHDFLNGEYTPLQAYLDWIQGKFKTANTNPNAEMAGLGWLNSPDGGRTLYIGSRKNGSRVVRIYEKGIEQGDKTSLWVRFELQMRNRDIVIDHEILLSPGEYLTGAYPICEELFMQYREDLKKPERVQKMQEISVEHMLHHASLQVSPTIKTLKHMGFSDEEVTQLLENFGAKMSKRLHPNAFDVAYPFVEYIKENKRKPSEIELRKFITQKHFEKQEQAEQKIKPATPEELKQFRENLNSQIYLKAVFGKGFTRELQEYMSYDEYLHIRYGSFQPKYKELVNESIIAQS